jgi:hypothetical protein
LIKPGHTFQLLKVRVNAKNEGSLRLFVCTDGAKKMGCSSARPLTGVLLRLNIVKTFSSEYPWQGRELMWRFVKLFAVNYHKFF